MRVEKNLEEVLMQIVRYEGKEVELLSRLVFSIRPDRKQRKKGICPCFDQLLTLLQEEESYRTGLRNYLSRLLDGKKISRSLVDAGIVSGTDFWYELRKRLIYKVLPYQPDPNTIDYVLVNVFYEESDIKWIMALGDDRSRKLFDLLGFRDLEDQDIRSPVLLDTLFAIRSLSHRITGIAFESDVLQMAPEYENFESPFVALQDEIDEFLDDLRSGKIQRHTDTISYKQLRILLTQCREFIRRAYKNREKLGISFRVHQQLMNLERMLDRMEILLGFVLQDTRTAGAGYKTIDVIRNLIHFNAGKTVINGYFNKATQLMAYEITQHTGRTGEHYITKNLKEYFHMLKSALGGGLIVGILCVLKMVYSMIDTSLFGKAFLYSMNYAMGFIAIYLLHFTLATKQPAMTAATLARAFAVKSGDKDKYANVTELIVRTMRSQFIAFVGNVFMAFPVSLLIVFVWQLLFGVNIATTKADHLLHDLSHIDSPAAFHAAIAGVFLFVSGLISGHVSNRSLYNRIPLRIQNHPVLKMFMRPARRKKLADYYARNAGGIISNFWFGIFLGSTVIVGTILGLPLDIRHITFAAGNFAIGLFGKSFDVSGELIFWSIVGIGIIGFMNFIVSFTLSLMLAMRSRAIPFTELIDIIDSVRARFFIQPWTFFWPPKNRRQPKTGMPPTTET